MMVKIGEINMSVKIIIIAIHTPIISNINRNILENV